MEPIYVRYHFICYNIYVIYMNTIVLQRLIIKNKVYTIIDKMLIPGMLVRAHMH